MNIKRLTRKGSRPLTKNQLAHLIAGLEQLTAGLEGVLSDLHTDKPPRKPKGKNSPRPGKKPTRR
jgi:hypothetical protein